MKKIIYIITIFAAVACLASCESEQLDTKPTTAISGDELMGDADKSVAVLNGVYRKMYTSGWSVSGNGHQASAYMNYVLMADVMGDDHIMQAMGSGWYWFDALYGVNRLYDRKSWRCYDIWAGCYEQIANLNYLLAAEETMSGSAKAKNYTFGQAYALRAFNYMILANTFCRSYIGHQDDPGLPIYTEPTTPETKGEPRAKLSEVYKLIKEDAAKAVELLSETNERMHVSHIDHKTALGIQARVAMNMGDWDTMLQASSKAIELANKEGLTVKKGKDVIMKGMNDVSQKDVMWGSEVIADQSAMWAAFFTHMDYDAEKYGYRAPKTINANLYAQMGENDCRRNWWYSQKEGNHPQYLQKKFKFKGNPKDWMGDYIWMRLPEMYLMKAEAECRKGMDAEAAKTLNSLVKERDADYDCSTKTGTALGKLTSDLTGSLLEAIIIQRRIELWSEYGRWWDIKRLRQGFVRTAEMGFPEKLLLQGKSTNDPESWIFTLMIPQSEFDGNENMTDADQNPNEQ